MNQVFCYGLVVNVDSVNGNSMFIIMLSSNTSIFMIVFGRKNIYI